MTAQPRSHIHVLSFKRKWFIRKQYSTAQKVKKAQYWIFELREFVNVQVFKMRFICVQNVMFTIVAFMQQHNFGYLLRLITISGTHGDFHFPLTCM